MVSAKYSAVSRAVERRMAIRWRNNNNKQTNVRRWSVGELKVVRRPKGH